MGAETELALLTHAKKMNEKFREETEVFPAGLRVLAVDDDRVCLLILGKMLQQCHYKGTLANAYLILMFLQLCWKTNQESMLLEGFEANFSVYIHPYLYSYLML